MARETTTRGKGSEDSGGGVSFRSKDAVQTGLFAGGQCVLSFIFGMFDYKARGKHPALIVSLKDENGEVHEEPYGVGSGWKISKDGTRLIPSAGQTGLPNSCDAILYMFGPLEEAMEAAGLEMPGGDDVTALDGIVAEVMRKPVQKRDFADDRRGGRKQGEDDRPKTKLVVTEVLSGPGEADAAPAKGKAAAKGASNVTPISKGRKPAADDDDDDEDDDATPARGKAKTAAGKPVPADDDTDDLDTMTIEALIEALEDESPLAVDDLEAALLAQLKGNPDRKKIAARATEEDFLAIAEGWRFDAKKGVVTLKVGK